MKLNNKTIIYYSSNREDPDFEQRVVDTLLLNGGYLPIISVTQKPMTLGKNICVGDVGVSGFNMFRQVQIALENCATDFVISAEADCLYPPDYFEFTPEHKDVCYRDRNLYVMPDLRDYFFYKEEGATHAQIVGRQFYLDTLNKLFEGAPKWAPNETNFPKERWKQEDVFTDIKYWRSENPVFQIKTHNGMRYFTHSSRVPIPEINYWGSGKPIRKYYIHGKVQS